MSKGKWNLKKVSDLAYEIQIKKSATPQQIEHLCRWLRVMISEYQSLQETLGSAETGGEKAAPGNILNAAEVLASLLREPQPGLASWHEAVERQARRITNHFGIFPDEAEWRKANFPRSSQNQTVSGGVEGAHEGTTVDKSGSREPEKLNNAQKEKAKFEVYEGNMTALHYGDQFILTMLGGGHLWDYQRKCDKLNEILALAESSLSSPPPRLEELVAKITPENIHPPAEE